MARVPCMRALCRHPGTILYHIGLLVIVVVTLLKVSNYSEITTMQKVYEKRDVEIKKSTFMEDPSMPLDRIADEELAEWISELIKGEKSGGKDFEEDVEKRRNRAENIPGTIEVLGEGGSSPNATGNIDDGNHPELLADGSIPVKKKLGVGNRNGKKQSPPGPALPKAKVSIVKPNFQGEANPSSKREMNNSLSRSINGEGADTRENNLDNLSSKSRSEMRTRSNVLIVAAMRTGSSFLGELFQQRHDFFYMFEPGIPLMHKLDSMNLTRRVMYTKLIDMLTSFYHCNFDNVPFFVKDLNERTLHARKQAVPALVTTQFCRRERMSRGRPKEACDPVSEAALETACRSRDNTAIKSIRILDINLMISAIKDPYINLKLIHLVRDPRSMIVSRLKLIVPTIQVFNVTELSDTIRNILNKYCSNWLQNYEIGHYVPLMRKNYLMVRYEDLALQPYETARKIYDFVGLGTAIPDSVQKWLDQNTNVNDPSKKKSVAFSTKRDSKAVLVDWKRRLTLEMARAIEEVGDCTRLMKATGYKFIGYDLQALTNNDHLVEPLPSTPVDASAFDFL